MAVHDFGIAIFCYKRLFKLYQQIISQDLKSNEYKCEPVLN